MILRAFQYSDINPLLGLLSLNVPAYFNAAELKDFKNYLSSEVDEYFVLEDSKVIVGGGGINYGFEQGLSARISWDVIHPHEQGKGAGTRLLQYRINKIQNEREIKCIVVRTTQLAFKFYEKNGFVLQYKASNYWAPGIDLYFMRMRLAR